MTAGKCGTVPFAMALERELKLGVWPGFALPDLAGIADGATVGEPVERRLEATYYDTADLRLLRRGVTVRCRRGEGAGATWTAKLPVKSRAPGLARTEVNVNAGPARMPRLFADIVRGWALGAALSPVAQLNTARRTIQLRDAAGGVLAMIEDDEVSILRGERVAARFRELEVELTEAAPEPVLAAVAERLRAAGAQAVDQVPKLVHALGAPALEAWDLAPRPAGGTTAEVVTARLTAATAQIVDHHAAVVLGEGPEGVRRMRAGARRLRADLRTFAPLLDGDAGPAARDGLRWVVDELSRVRDLDVLMAQLAGSAAAASSGALLDRLADERGRAMRRLKRILRGAPYAALLEQVAALAAEPPVDSAKAGRPAAEVVPALVRRPLRRLRAEVDALPGDPDGDALDALRGPVRRLRFAVEAAAPVAGSPARRALRELAAFEDVVVGHHRARAALDRLRALAEGAPPAEAWAAGVLAGVQLERAAASRSGLRRAWDHAARPSLWRWAR